MTHSQVQPNTVVIFHAVFFHAVQHAEDEIHTPTNAFFLLSFQFLGKWYVIQKTSTGSRCLVYNFTHVPEEKGYRVEQVSEHLLLGLTSVDHKYRYSGLLQANENAATAANMTVRFPLSEFHLDGS